MTWSTWSAARPDTAGPGWLPSRLDSPGPARLPGGSRQVTLPPRARCSSCWPARRWPEHGPISRPLRQAAGFARTAAQSAVRDPPHPMPPRSGPAGPWPSGMTLMKVSGQFRASRAAEAAARRSVDEMSGLLGEVSLELRTSVNVVCGFAQYCLQRGTPPPAGFDPMMQRIAEEAARMDTLTRCLEAHSAGSGISHPGSVHGGGAAARR